MKIKSLVNAALYGAASTLGSMVVIKGAKVVSDPTKKAKIKRNVKEIKNTLIGGN